MPLSSFADTPSGDSVKVTLTIDGQTRRNVLLGEKFLDEKKFTIPKGQTVKDLIVEYCQKNDVKYTLNGENYLSSLHGLTEKEYGDLSGWTYHVWDKDKNKYIMPNKGIGEYKIEKDEKIKFVYSINNFWDGYRGEEKKASETTKALVEKIDKSKMSGYLAAALFNTGGDVPASYKNVARAKVAELKKTSSVADYYEVILAVLASGQNPYAAWGRNLIAEVAERDILNGSIEDMIYAIAIVNSGQFVLPENTTWDVKKVKAALEEKQNADGSFGEGSDPDKVIRTARVFNFIEFDSFSKVRNKMEDYLAGQMHQGGGLPLSKEDYFATAEVVLARSNKSQDPDGRLSYRVIGNWNAGDKPSPYKALLDFFIESQGGFKKDYLEKNIDPAAFEIGTLAMIRTDKYYNDKQYAGRSLFKFGKVEPPSNSNEAKLWIDSTYEKIVAVEKVNANISEESGYILRRMGEQISEEQIKILEKKINLKPTDFEGVYKSVLAAIAVNNSKSQNNISKITEIANTIDEGKLHNYNYSMLTCILSEGMGIRFSDKYTDLMKKHILAFEGFSSFNQLRVGDKHYALGGAITLIGDTSKQKNYINNIERLIQNKTSSALLNKEYYVPNYVTALNLLGEDIFDAKYTTKDGKQLVSLLQERDITTKEMFFAVASYKLRQQDGSNIFKYSFGKSTDEKIQDTIEKFVDKADLQAYVLKKYDDRDVSSKVAENKTEVVKKKYQLGPRRDLNLYFNLMAGGENLEDVDGHNLIDGITEKETINSKGVHINSLLILNSADYKTDPSHPESRETFKSKVLKIKEFKDGQGQYLLSDAGLAMMALAPYYKAKDAETVKIIDAFLAKLHQSMKNDGTIAPFGKNIQLELPYHSHNQAAIVQALVYLGIDPHTDARCIKNGKSLVDGLYTFETENGFAMKHGDEAKADSMYTRAVLAALIDYQLFKQNKKQIYDYSDIIKPSSKDKTYDVTFEITPAEAKDAKLLVIEKGKSDVIAPEKGVYKLKAGDYKVEAKKSGYKTLVKKFTVTDDVATHLVELQLEKAEETPFKFKEDTQTILGYKTKDVPQELEIPAAINGIAVKKIAREAFISSKLSKPITKLTLPEGLESIEMMAFQGNTFTEIVIPSTVKEINGGFRLCKQLVKVEFAPNSQLEILGENAFAQTAIKEMVLPNNVKVIQESAFQWGAIRNIVLPEGLTEIQTSAFALTNVQEITIPSTVEKLNFNLRGKQGSNGLFFRTFEDDAKTQLAFTRVKDLSGKATIENTRGVVNPVEVTVKYIDKATGQEIANMLAVKAVGMNKKIVTEFAGYKKDMVISAGDMKFISDYKNPYKETKVYTDKEALQVILGNYFTKNSEWTFDAPEIAGYNKPVAITKTLLSEQEEVIFEYTRNDQKFKLTLNGEGLTSKPTAGDLAANTNVEIKIVAPSGKVFKKLFVNNKEVIAQKDGLAYKYSFRIEQDTTVSVEYENATTDKEIQVTAENTKLKLGEKTKIKVQYRGQDIALPNKDIVLEFDPKLLTLDEKLGEVTVIGSGTVVLTAKLKTDPNVKDQVQWNVAPVKVTLRIEDVNKTLYKPAEVEINSLKVQKGVDYYEDITFKNPNTFLAVKNLLQANGKNTAHKSVFDCGSTGNWMSVIDSLDPSVKYSKNASFMYSVNNKMANEGVGQFVINNDDEITIYVAQDYAQNDGYAYFEQEVYHVKAGEELTAKILIIGLDKQYKPLPPTPLKGASLLNDTVLLKDKAGKEIASDENGEFKVTFDQEGTYYISAQKVENKINRISRPYAVVKVSGNVAPTPTIVSVEKIQDIEVAKGTQRNDLPLPKTVKATLSNTNKTDLTLTWSESEPAYDANTPDDYFFTASYELPSGVTGDKPTVRVKVVVKDSTAPTTPSIDEILQWAKTKQDLIADSYTAPDAKLDEWMVAEIGKLGKPITSANLQKLKDKILDADGNIKLTGAGDLAKAVLALRAAGIDPENYYDKNVVEALVNANAGASMWTVGPKLWALSSDDYNNADQEIEKLIEIILKNQGADGLWNEWGYWTDTTGFALYGLAPYYDRQEVKEAVEKVVDEISEKQLQSGDIVAPPGNLNSLVMVAGGLWSCDPNYLTDARLTKDGNTLLHAFKLYDIKNTAGFLWKTNENDPNPMATEQAFRAFVTLFSMRDGKGRVFDYRGTPKRVLGSDDVTIIGVESLTDISVDYGTKREDISFPATATLNLSDNTQQTVALTWEDSVPAYDENKAGDYTFTASYDLPAGVSGAKPAVNIKVTVEDIQVTIKSVQAVQAIEVSKGTEEEAAIAKLPTTTLIKDNKGKFHIVTLQWSVDTYDKEILGDYPATGTFELPQDVAQSDPATVLEVKTVIKVVENAAENPVNKDELQKLVEAIEANLPTKEDYTDESYEKFEQALAVANQALTNNVSQDKVNKALFDLQDAKDKLQLKADKKALEEQIELAKEKLQEEAKYEDAGVQKLKEELAKAETLFNDPNAEQTKINEQVVALAAAIAGLKVKSDGGGGGTPSTDITVSFMLKSIERGGTAEQIWIERQNYVLSQNARVRDLFEKALNAKGIAYRNPSGNYVESIKSPVDGEWFGQFSNGPRSGWMYTVNGKHPNLGISDYRLSDRDEVIWHYTNDYTKEEGSSGWSSGSGLSASASEEKKKETAIIDEKTPLVEMPEGWKGFNDVADTAWYAKAVNALASKGLLKGAEGNFYRPNEKITRAEFIAILGRLDGTNIDDATSMAFRDVKKGAWYYNSISWALANNIASGYGKEFKPNAPISREEMAVMLLNYTRYNIRLKLEKKADAKNFADQNKISAWAKESVMMMQRAGVVGGKENNRFAPKENATRAEAAEMIYRMIG